MQNLNNHWYNLYLQLRHFLYNAPVEIYLIYNVLDFFSIGTAGYIVFCRHVVQSKLKITELRTTVLIWFHKDVSKLISVV